MTPVEVVTLLKCGVCGLAALVLYYFVQWRSGLLGAKVAQVRADVDKTRAQQRAIDTDTDIKRKDAGLPPYGQPPPPAVPPPDPDPPDSEPLPPP